MPVWKDKSGKYHWGKGHGSFNTAKEAYAQAAAAHHNGYKGKSLDGGNTMSEENKLAKSINNLVGKIEKSLPEQGGEVEQKAVKDWAPGAAAGAGIGAMMGNPVAGALIGGAGQYLYGKYKKDKEAKANQDVQTVRAPKGSTVNIVHPTTSAPATSSPVTSSPVAAQPVAKKTIKPAAKPVVKPVAKKTTGTGVTNLKYTEDQNKDMQPVNYSTMSMDSIIAKSQAKLRLRKAITVIKGYQPMSTLDITKAFGEVPVILKDENSRPPADWFEFAVKELQPYTSQPRSVAVNFWYGKDLTQKLVGGALLGGGLGSLVGHPLAGAAIGAGVEESGILGNKKKSADDNINKIAPAIAAAAIPAAVDVATDPKKVQGLKQNIASMPGASPVTQAMMGQKSEDKNVSKLLGGALAGGGLGMLVGHPLAGAAIGAGAEEALKSDEGLDYEAIGRAVVEAIKGVEAQTSQQTEEEIPPEELNSIAQKAVAEAISSTYAPKQGDRKKKFDNGGQSEVYSDGASLNIQDLAGKSKTEKTL